MALERYVSQLPPSGSPRGSIRLNEAPGGYRGARSKRSHQQLHHGHAWAEDHIEKAIRGQIEDLKDYPEAVAELRGIHRKIEHHIADLRGLSDRRQAGGVVESMKRAGSAVLGAAAGVIDLVRSEGLPKNLRDDYTALSLAHIGYVMLHTTGLSLEDREVADLAQQGFTDYAEAITRLQGIIPEPWSPTSGRKGSLRATTSPRRCAGRSRRCGSRSRARRRPRSLVANDPRRCGPGDGARAARWRDGRGCADNRTAGRA